MDVLSSTILWITFNLNFLVFPLIPRSHLQLLSFAPTLIPSSTSTFSQFHTSSEQFVRSCPRIQVNFLSQIRLFDNGDGPKVAKHLVDGVNRAFPFVSSNDADDIIEVLTPMLFHLKYKGGWKASGQVVQKISWQVGPSWQLAQQDQLTITSKTFERDYGQTMFSLMIEVCQITANSDMSRFLSWLTLRSIMTGKKLELDFGQNTKVVDGKEIYPKVQTVTNLDIE
ncbi:hypothetical protein LguiA_033805 [Lonicera macranthoides]